MSKYVRVDCGHGEECHPPCPGYVEVLVERKVRYSTYHKVKDENRRLREQLKANAPDHPRAVASRGEAGCSRIE